MIQRIANPTLAVIALLVSGFAIKQNRDLRLQVASLQSNSLQRTIIPTSSGGISMDQVSRLVAEEVKRQIGTIPKPSSTVVQMQSGGNSQVVGGGIERVASRNTECFAAKGSAECREGILVCKEGKKVLVQVAISRRRPNIAVNSFVCETQ